MTAPQGGVVLIGAGRMGSALLRGWLANSAASPIWVIEPQPSDEVREWARTGAINLSPAMQPGCANAGAIVLAMKPQAIKAERELLQKVGSAESLLVSIAAGVTMSFLSQALGGGNRLIRAMPNTPGAIGLGITVLYADRAATEADRTKAQSLMSPLGETLWIDDEALMDAVTAVSGSGPAYVFLLAEAFAAAARDQGLDEVTAEKLARFTVSGSGALLASDRRPVSALRHDVTSPGGTTEAALKVLMAPDGMVELMKRAIAAATARGRDLGKV